MNTRRMRILVCVGALAAFACTPNPRALPDRLPAIEGKVVERLDAPPYSFLRLAQPSGDIWVGVPVSLYLKDAVVKVQDAVLVRNHRLPALDRTLEAVYFGRLVSQ
jgi:hypothetical protein